MLRGEPREGRAGEGLREVGGPECREGHWRCWHAGLQGEGWRPPVLWLLLSSAQCPPAPASLSHHPTPVQSRSGQCASCTPLSSTARAFLTDQGPQLGEVLPPGGQWAMSGAILGGPPGLVSA